jgi:hypothetical protein
MQLPSCSLKVDFLTPMIFRISAAAELALFVLTNRALNSFAVPRLPFGPRDSLNAQAPLAKISIRSKMTDLFLKNRTVLYLVSHLEKQRKYLFFLAGGLAGISRDVEARSGHGSRIRLLN